MLARPKSVQWEERDKVRRQQEEEVGGFKHDPDNGMCVLIDLQAMRQLQNANVHRNVVKPSKGSGLSFPSSASASSFSSFPSFSSFSSLFSFQAPPQPTSSPSKNGCFMRLTTETQFANAPEGSWHCCAPAHCKRQRDSHTSSGIKRSRS